ncbi:hypothetical protein [Agarivorans sp. Alg241-V36]|uniref:hypothetical protein n=1 Tax=Agarivorans sp. Alg241-V36 TaxID=2305992 RepID=UPI0013CFD245|nr:hypothetical protein [Agarivorans sp. Alg241-V36]
MEDTQRYRVGHYSKGYQGKVDVAIHQDDFPAACYEELQKETKVIFDLQPILMMYGAAKDNFEEFLGSIAECVSFWRDAMPQKGLAYNQLNHLVLISQRINNFLSSASAFLTSAEIKLGKVFGVDSLEVNEWNRYRRNLHKNSFSYRFLYELRNYSQHNNLPISSLSVNAEKMSGDINLSVNVYRDEILDSGFKWKKLRPEIEQKNVSFDLFPFIKEYMLLIDELMDKYFEANSEVIDCCSLYLNILSQRFRFPKNAVPVIYKGDTPYGLPVPEDFEQIPIEQFTWILEKRRASSGG